MAKVQIDILEKKHLDTSAIAHYTFSAMSIHIQSVTFPAADDGPLLEGILHLIPRTDHFLAGRETEVAAPVADFVTAHQGDLRCQDVSGF